MTGTYNIRDDNGTLLGTLEAQTDGSIAIEHAGSGEQAVLDGDGLSVPAVSTDETHTKKIGANDYLYVGDYDGADADARLTAALNDASDGVFINLEDATYQADRTFSGQVCVSGISERRSIIEGTWTFNDRSEISSLRIDGSGGIVLNNTLSQIIQIGGSGSSNGITVQEDRVILSNISSIPVTFASGTSGGLIDTSVSVAVTDNGSNTIGDVV